MSESNKLADVVYLQPEYLVDQAEPRNLPGETKYIRYGAATEWIDPKVQPIPEGLDRMHPIHCKVKIDDEWDYTDTKPAFKARKLQGEGKLLGYVILP